MPMNADTHGMLVRADSTTVEINTKSPTLTYLHTLLKAFHVRYYTIDDEPSHVIVFPVFSTMTSRPKNLIASMMMRESVCGDVLILRKDLIPPGMTYANE